MKIILKPLLTLLVGLLQAVVATILFLVGNLLTLLWNGSVVFFYAFVFSKHKNVTKGWWGNVLGYLDGTLGIASWFIPYEAAMEIDGRIRLVNFTQNKGGLIDVEAINGIS